MLEPFDKMKFISEPEPGPQKKFSMLEPKSWDDYIPFARWMIYKKLLIALLILITLFSFIIILLLRPKPAPDLPTIPVYYYLDELLKLYSGEVILVNESDKVIYRGQVENGLRAGWGKSLFAFDGSVKYEGGFKNDLYEGQGVLYSDFSKSKYEGHFANGLFNGQGTLFEENAKKYEGSFINDLPGGEGVLYDKDGNIRYQGGFARGVREGTGLETGANGFPIYEGGFRANLYDGQGVLYARDGSKLRFEGVFIRGKPSREGKIYNPQGQLLYDGAVFDGNIDCVNLLGMGAKDWKASIKETPVIYFGDSFVGCLYGELGIAAIGLYAVVPPETGTDEVPFPEVPGGYLDGENPTGIDHTAQPEAEPSPFSGDDIIFYTMLTDGYRYAEQLSLDDGAEYALGKISGFEAFMTSRLAAVNDPAAKFGIDAVITRIDDNTYKVTGLPDAVDFDGDCVYRDLIYYYSGGKTLSKGGVADVIHLRKKQFGE